MLRVLDLFSGAGGAAVGYHREGFGVVGVDIRPQPNYPYAFVQDDALATLRVLLDGGSVIVSAHGRYAVTLDDFDGIHASPTCQHASSLRHVTGVDYANLIPPTRELLVETGLPYVIENVVGAELIDPVRLCGSSFGLGVTCRDGVYRQLRRHRLFECSFPVPEPPCSHAGQPIGVYGTGGGGQMTRGYKGFPEEYGPALGIDWATRREMAQAIPPAYTEHVGRALRAAIEQREAA